MAIKTSKKAYLAIFLIGVVVVIAGISVYGIYQRDTSQTPTTIYKELTDAEEELVKENIRSNIEQQKRKETKSIDKKQPSYVDNMPIQNDDKDEKPGLTYDAPVPIVTRADASDIEASDQQSQSEEIQANMADIENLHKQFAPKGVDWGNTETIKITSKDELKKVIAELKASGDPKYKVMTKFLKDVDMNKATEINVEFVK